MIKEDDFDKWSEKLISFGNLTSEKADNLRSNMKQIWRTYFLPADIDNGLISLLDNNFSI